MIPLLLPILLALAPGPEGPSSDPVFVATRLDGSTATGRLRGIGDAEGIRLLDMAGAEQALPTRSILKLAREHPSPYPPPKHGLVVFPGGDRLALAGLGAAGERALDVQSFPLEKLSIPLDAMLGLILTPPAQVDALDELIARVKTEPRDAEVLWLVNGDRRGGSLLGIGEKTLSFRSGGSRVDFDRSAIRALGFDPEQIRYNAPAGPYWEVSLVDGSRLGLAGVRLDAGNLAGTARFGAPIRVALGEVSRVHARHEGVAYLSEREASKVIYDPWLGGAAPVPAYRRDATVEGHPLLLSGQEYDRGLGTHSRTLLAYVLTPGDLRFQATVGVDDRAGPTGSVVFRVLVNGKERYAGPPMSARDTPVAVDVDLAGGRFVILSTEYGRGGDVRDLADWAEARIIR